MFKKMLFSLLFLLPSILFAQDSNQELIVQKSNKSIFESKLECDAKFSTGSFQNCWLELLHDQQIIKDAEIFIEGGMPAHAHGLPTAPKAIWSDVKNAYEIKGLKFSMPGEWQLSFGVKLESRKLRDQLLMKIEVD